MSNIVIKGEIKVWYRDGLNENMSGDIIVRATDIECSSKTVSFHSAVSDAHSFIRDKVDKVIYSLEQEGACILRCVVDVCSVRDLETGLYYEAPKLPED